MGFSSVDARPYPDVGVFAAERESNFDEELLARGVVVERDLERAVVPG
jgi:hypothetical protein